MGASQRFSSIKNRKEKSVQRIKTSLNIIVAECAKKQQRRDSAED